VTGTVTARYVGECRRCLEPARGTIAVEVRELCAESGDGETAYALSPKTLDLEPIVHDACILELPLAPLCREGCAGLCPQCGANRNTERCDCRALRDPRFAALSLLETDQESEGPTE
jgi:uncharacterized protein